MQLRARVNREIRQFFAELEVLEVETPILLRTPNADANITGLTSDVVHEGRRPETAYLRTSPEHAMKRLVAAGSGSIYQLGKVFRDAEAGRAHSPEFTLLEWYRVGFDHNELMVEVESLIRYLTPDFCAVRVRYRDAFVRWAGVDPWTADTPNVLAAVERFLPPPSGLDRAGGLDLLLDAAITPGMRADYPGQGVFLYDYPVDQAALARTLPNDPSAAARFELFIDGRELANGYWELSDPQEQRRRFEQERVSRAARGENLALDEPLLAALAAGLPDCAGVALGVDRLLMSLASTSDIDEVLTFPFSRA